MSIGNSLLHLFEAMTLIRSSTHIYHAFLNLEKPGNNALLLLTSNTMSFARKLKVLGKWASSWDGQNLYNQMIRDIPEV